LAKRWCQYVADEREAHLSAVTVAGQLQMDMMTGSHIGKVRFVHKQDYRFAWGNARQCRLHVRRAVQHVVHADHIETTPLYSVRTCRLSRT